MPHVCEAREAAHAAPARRYGQSALPGIPPGRIARTIATNGMRAERARSKSGVGALPAGQAEREASADGGVEEFGTASVGARDVADEREADALA
jgi:hypothetical protein